MGLNIPDTNPTPRRHNICVIIYWFFSSSDRHWFLIQSVSGRIILLKLVFARSYSSGKQCGPVMFVRFYKCVLPVSYLAVGKLLNVMKSWTTSFLYLPEILLTSARKLLWKKDNRRKMFPKCFKCSEAIVICLINARRMTKTYRNRYEKQSRVSAFLHCLTFAKKYKWD